MKPGEGNLRIEALTPELFQEWDDFCLKTKEASFWHTTDFLTYEKVRRSDMKTQPLHFLVKRGLQTLAVCPFAIETHKFEGKEYNSLSLAGDSIPSPALADGIAPADRFKIFQFIYQYWDKIAAENKAVRALVRLVPMSESYMTGSQHIPNEFLSFDFQDASIHTQITDLRQSEELLWAQMRRSYKSLIHKFDKKYQLRIYDSQSGSPEQFEGYRYLHAKARGFATRPGSTFDMMHGWIKKGRAVLFSAYDGDKMAGSLFMVLYKRFAPGWSSCMDPDLPPNDAVSHWMHWHTKVELKKRGMHFYETGRQYYGPQIAYSPYGKELAIAFFLRGMGGQTVPFLRGEKFYDATFFKQDMLKRIEGIAEHIEKRNLPEPAPDLTSAA